MNQMKKALNRLSRGVMVCGVKLQIHKIGERFYAYVSSPEGRMIGAYCAGTLHLMHKVICGYYPSAARYFGSARQYKKA